MSSTRWPRILKGLISVLFVCVASMARAQTLVAHPGVHEVSIPLGTARAFFYMRLREWPDGTPVRVFVLSDRHPIHVEFSKEVLGVFPDRLSRTWDRIVFAGLGQAPHMVDSLDEMREKVAATPGAIGYLPEDRIDGTVHPIRIE